ncbi:phage baseplate assembly protein V, partial [Lacinutrix chionoecetis]
QKELGEITPWIRIVTPHAGGDKGFHFVPEIDEEILVGFEGGNAEHPYMMGSLYNGGGKAGAFQSDANNIKAIKTRSGHIIEFNDTAAGESITIKDKNSNVIFIDTVSNNIQVTANNNIEITAAETMTLSANNIKIKAKETIDMSAGKDFNKSIAENYNVMTKNSTKVVEDKLSTDAKSQTNVADEITVSSNKENLTLTSGKTVDVQSKEKVKLF